MKTTRKKPKFISHYLVLRDLLAGKDPRQYSDVHRYLTSRIENIKCDFVRKHGLKFDETAQAHTTYAHYKPYILLRDKENIKRAKKLLAALETDEIKRFLGLKQ